MNSLFKNKFENFEQLAVDRLEKESSNFVFTIIPFTINLHLELGKQEGIKIKL